MLVIQVFSIDTPITIPQKVVVPLYSSLRECWLEDSHGLHNLKLAIVGKCNYKKLFNASAKTSVIATDCDTDLSGVLRYEVRKPPIKE